MKEEKEARAEKLLLQQLQEIQISFRTFTINGSKTYSILILPHQQHHSYEYPLLLMASLMWWCNPRDFSIIILQEINLEVVCIQIRTI